LKPLPVFACVLVCVLGSEPKTPSPTQFFKRQYILPRFLHNKKAAGRKTGKKSKKERGLKDQRRLRRYKRCDVDDEDDERSCTTSLGRPTPKSRPHPRCVGDGRVLKHLVFFREKEKKNGKNNDSIDDGIARSAGE